MCKSHYVVDDSRADLYKHTQIVTGNIRDWWNYQIFLSTDIAYMIYFTYIISHLSLKSKTKSFIKLQLQKHIFLKFYNPQLILFIDVLLVN